MLLNDFKPFNRITYKDYVTRKGYPILSIDNPPKVEKRFDRLYLEGKVIPLEDKTIIDVLNLLKADVYRYTENPVEVLNNSALFLADFSSTLTIDYSIAQTPVDLNLILHYEDEFNSLFSFESFRTISQAGTTLEHTVKDNKLFLDTGGILRVTYRAIELRLSILKEFVLSDINQLHSFKGSL